MLLLIVGAVYAPTFFVPLMVDDHRMIRQMRLYRDGWSNRLDLYGFARANDQVRAERLAGYFPWWVRDELRFERFRPVAEYALYLDYLVFGSGPLGFRVSSVAWYVVGVWLTLSLFRLLVEERIARWGALVFALAGGHAVTVAFAAARCDLIALVAGLGSVIAAARYLLGGRRAWLALASLLFLAALGAKEVSVALAAGPLLLAWGMRGGPYASRVDWRRAATATGLLGALAVAFLALYSTGGFESNGEPLLDPIRATRDYLVRAPGRMALMLSTWLVPMNPFVFEFRRWLQPLMVAYGVLGVLGVIGAGVIILRRSGPTLAAGSMAAWALVGLPILACTPADDRVMLVPSVGLSLLAALWLAPRPGERVPRLAAILFLIAPLAYVQITLQYVRHLESASVSHLRAGLASLPPQSGPDECLFFLNLTQITDALWLQDRLEGLGERPGVRAAVLSDAARVDAVAVGPQVLRLRSCAEPFLASFLGRMGSPRSVRPTVGEVFDAGAYRVVVTEVRGSDIHEVQVEFPRPLDWPGYRFYELGLLGPARPVRFEIPAVAVARH